MARRRRSPEQARTEILDAAERLLLSEGPAAIKIARVAAEASMSHPGLLHHFKSAEQLTEALHKRLSVGIREDVLALLAEPSSDRAVVFDAAAARLADPAKGRLLAWVLAMGGSPFPPAQEQGLSAVADVLKGEDAHYKLLLVVLAMFGESMLGVQLRERLGLDEDPAVFRRWLLKRLMEERG